MHYGIPKAYNFCIKILYRCKFHQFYYMDRVQSLYIILKIPITEAIYTYVSKICKTQFLWYYFLFLLIT
jgi:hypothetical protein